MIINSNTTTIMISYFNKVTIEKKNQNRLMKRKINIIRNFLLTIHIDVTIKKNFDCMCLQYQRVQVQAC